MDPKILEKGPNFEQKRDSNDVRGDPNEEFFKIVDKELSYAIKKNMGLFGNFSQMSDPYQAPLLPGLQKTPRPRGR